MRQNRRGMSETPLDPARSPVFRLLLLVNLTARPFARLFARRHQLSLTEWRVLLTLAGEPELTGAEIADALGLDRMAISRAIAALERRGRVSRRADPADARRAPLALTQAGRALYERIVPSARSRERALMAALDPAEQRQLGLLLDKLIAAARGLPDE